MKNIVTFLLTLFATLNVHAQLTDTKWKGTLKINEDVVTLFDFGKDTLKLTRFANNTTIENMSYTIADSTLILKKTAGQSDCDNEVIGKYKFLINGDKLSIKLVTDGCYDRSSVLDNTSFTRFTWPAEVKTNEAILRQYPGVYALDDQHQITIGLENGRLTANSKTNLPVKTTLYPLSETRFSFHMGDITLEFVKGPNGMVIKFVVHENGKDYDWIKEK
jgi:hypothetical protein